MGEISINLTSEELVYLVNNFEGEILPGISDPYEDMSESEKTERIIQVEERLQEKGYRKRLFGGKVEYDTELSEMIKICASFEKYIGFDKRVGDENLTTERFYDANDEWLQISGDSENLKLKKCSENELKSFMEEIPKDTGSKSNQISILLPQESYDEIAGLVQGGNVDEARDYIKQFGLNEFNELFLIDGLSYKLSYAAITIISRDDESISIDTVSALISDEAMAELYIEAEEGDVVMVGFRKAATGNWPKIKGVIDSWLIAS